jgi:hypothetical protein
MAVPANTYQTYQTKGIREDLSDIIERIAPTETPFMSSISKDKASNSFVEWQTQDLASVSVNAQIEGDDATNVAITPTVRLGNYTQISTKPFQVTGTNSAVKSAGRKDEMAYQASLKSAELKREMEVALCSAGNGVAGAVSNATTSVIHAGSSSTPRLLRGLEGWIADNVELGATGVAPVYAMGSWTAPADGTTRALTEALFLSVAQKCYDAGGNPDVALMSSKVRSLFNAFNGGATKFNKMEDEKLHNTFDVYVSPFGSYKMINSRFVRNSNLFLLEMDKWCMSTLRPYQVQDLSKTGDSDKKMLVTEYTLKAKAPNANGAVKAIL